MSPYVRRTWSPQGETPLLYERRRRYDKVSAIAGLCCTPSGANPKLYFRLHPGENIKAVHVVAFLSALLECLDGNLLVVWDNIKVHKNAAVRKLVTQNPRIALEWLPHYAPELNPVEYLWAWLKTNPLANTAAYDIDEIAFFTRRHALSAQKQKTLLRGFLQHSKLFPLRL